MAHFLTEQAANEPAIYGFQKAVCQVVPAGSSVLVISKGDGRLLDLGDRRAHHFPSDEAGVYAGRYPATGAEAACWLDRAISQSGAEFLAIPATSVWWLTDYHEIRFLLAKDPMWHDERCTVYRLIEREARTLLKGQQLLGVELPDGAVALAQALSSTMMDAGELLHLAAASAAVPWNDGWMAVEIGAFHGQTTAFLAGVHRLLGLSVPILSIDPFEQVEPDPLNPQGSFAAYLRSIQAAGAQRHCFPLVAYSQDAAAVVPDRVGLLIVDGWHEYPAVSQDLALYAPKVVPGGVIFMDDYGLSYPGVVQAADEFFLGNRQFEVLHTSHFLIARRLAAARQRSSKPAKSSRQLREPAGKLP